MIDREHIHLSVRRLRVDHALSQEGDSSHSHSERAAEVMHQAEWSARLHQLSLLTHRHDWSSMVVAIVLTEAGEVIHMDIGITDTSPDTWMDIFAEEAIKRLDEEVVAVSFYFGTYSSMVTPEGITNCESKYVITVPSSGGILTSNMIRRLDNEEVYNDGKWHTGELSESAGQLGSVEPLVRGMQATIQVHNEERTKGESA